MGDDIEVDEAAERRYAFLGLWMPLFTPAFCAPWAMALLLVGLPAPKALGFWWVLTAGVLTMFYVVGAS